MIWSFIASFIRHSLTSAGAILVTKGLASQSDTDAAVGALMVLIGFSHSLWQKYKSSPPTSTSGGASPGSGVFLLVLAAALFARPGTVTAQTTNAVSQDLNQLGADMLARAMAMYPFTTNGQAVVSAGYGINTASKSQIEAVSLAVPMTPNVSLTAVGAHIGSQWEYGGGTLTFSKTLQAPVFGTITMSVGDGAVQNFTSHAVANYIYNQFDKTWHPWSKLDLHLGVCVANVSSIPGVECIAGGGFTLHW